MTWNFAEDQQLRFGASKTIARPQFREQAPQLYLDPESDRTFIGNPFLFDSEIVVSAGSGSMVSITRGVQNFDYACTPSCQQVAGEAPTVLTPPASAAAAPAPAPTAATTPAP